MAESAAGGAWRWLRFVLSGVILLAVLYLGYSCLRPADRTHFTAPLERLSANGVTYVANGSLYLVAQPDGSISALDGRPRNHDERAMGCAVRWLPAADGGQFREDTACGGAVFGRDGSPATGGLGLLRHPLSQTSKQVTVDLTRCEAPEEGTVRACATFGR